MSARGPADDDRPYVLEDQIGNLLRRAHQRATSLFLSHFGPSQLTPTQWAALVKLAETGPVSQNLLGRKTAMDPATIQGVVRRLEDRALIVRTPDPTDRRRFVLVLSPAGREAVERHKPDGFAVSAETLAPLAPEERARLVDLLRKLT